MAVFSSKPFRSSRANQVVAKNPLLFGIPFLLVMIGASYALAPLAQARYDLHDQKIKNMSKAQELHLEQNKKKFDIREEYFRLSANKEDDDWENKRVPRPKGLPEWGVPPPEPTPKKN